MAPIWNKLLFCGVTLGIGMALTACGKEQGSQSADYTTAVANIETVEARLDQVTLYDERQGRVRALRTAAIRPQVSGIITGRLFKQGDALDKGDALFQIEKDTYEIDVEMKQAELQQSIANLALLQSQLNRLETLDRSNAVSKQAFEEAGFNQQIAAATVEKNRASLKHSQLQLAYTRVRAPIAGIIGEVLVTEGSLVSSSDTTPLAVIKQIDQVYIDVRLPAVKLNELRRLLDEQNNSNTSGLAVTIQHSQNRSDDIRGRILFSGISVDETTGDLSVRIIADNPNNVLLPGMYVRTRIPRQQLPAVRIPEQALLRAGNGNPYVFVVVNGQFEQRDVVVEGIQNGEYIVAGGLNPKDLVIVKGQENLREGVRLNISSWQAVASK